MAINIIEYFLGLIILFGLVTSYEDIYESKIRNRYILIFISLGILLHIIYTLYYIIHPELSVNWIYLVETLTNGLIALTAGFILWLINFWSAGDAKLFFTYSLIIPISIYSIDKIPYFSSFYLIFNSFIPFLILAVGLTIKEKITNIKYGNIKQEITIKKILENGAYAFTITWVANIIINLLNINNNILSVIITSSLLIYVARKYIYENIPENMGNIKLRSIILIFVGITITVFRIAIDYKNILTFAFLWQFIVYYVLLSIIREYINSETKSFFTKQIHVLHLWQGMSLAEPIIEDKEKNKYIISTKRNIETALNAVFSNQLSNEDVKKIIKLYKTNRLDFNKVKIHKTIPFAPLMFIGAILTIIANGAFTNII